MEHKGTVTLETPRLILRRLTLADAEPMYRNWASDPGVTKFLTWPTHSSVEVTKQILALWASHYEELNYYQWGIVVKDENALIGTIAAVKTDDEIKAAEIGYCIGQNWWHKGYTSEALGAVINFLFDEVGVNRVAISHAVKNPASGRVAQKCGLTLEGTARAYFKSAAGEWLDIRTYSILREEFERARKGD